MLVKHQDLALVALKNNPQLLSHALRSRREMTLEERKNVCKGLEYSSIAFDTIGNVANDVGDLSGETLKPYTICVSIVSHLIKFGLNIASAALECDDVPFDELKEILDERFNALERKLDANTEALEKVSKLVNEAYVAIEQTRNEMNDGFQEILKKLDDQNIKSILIDLNTFIVYFEKEKKEIRKLPKDQYVKKLQEENGVLEFLRNSRLPNEDSLLSILFRLLDKSNKFTIPKSADDIMAFQALYVLFYGTQTYASIMFFLLEHHSYLADYYYQTADLEKFNEEFVTVKNIFDEFKSSLIGEDEDKPLLKEVMNVFEDVKNLPFIDKVDSNLYKDLLKKEKTLVELENKIKKMELPIILEIPDKAANVDFVDPVLKTPYGGWKKDSTVRYAIQLAKDGKYSKLSDWSKPFIVQEQANPTLTLSVDDKRRDRLIFRKIDNSKPELVGILKFPEVEFKDINRDLYNAAASIHKEQALKEVKKLVRIKADINVVFDLQRNALHAAAESGNDVVANFLINKGINVDVEDEKGFTPLHVASTTNRYNATLLLIKKGANVNAHTKSDLLTPLHIASKNGFLNTVEALLSSEKLNLNEKDVTGLTALHQAVVGGSKIVKSLTSKIDTDVNAKSNVGLTPFHVAVMNENRNVADALLESGRVNVNEGDVNGLTALHFASMTQNVENVEYLLSLDGININAQSTDIQFTPLHLAIYSKQKQVALELMKNANIDISLSAKGGLTPLHLSVATGQLKLCEELLNMNADIEAKTDEGYTPLLISVMHLEPDMTSLLLEKGSNIQAISNDGSNVLHLSVSLKLKDLVSDLLNRGVDTSIKNNENLIPLYIAIQNKDLDILRIFVQHQPDILQNKDAEKHIEFMYRVLVRDMYDYFKNPDSEKFKDYKELEPLDVCKKMGIYEMIKILSNDPKAEEPTNFLGAKVNQIELSLAMIMSMAKECIKAENEKTTRSPMCPEPSRMKRSSKRYIAAKNNRSYNSLFSQTIPSISKSTNKFSSPSLILENNRNSFSSPQFNSFQNFDGMGALLLLDLMIRKLNDEKYFKQTNDMYSDLELQAKALTITEKIEELLEIVSNVAPAEEFIDLSEVHSKVYKALKSGNENEIAKFLCPTVKLFFSSKLLQAASVEENSPENLMILIKKACSIDN